MYFQGDWLIIALTMMATAIMSKPYMYVIQQDNYRLKGLFKSKSIRSFYLADIVCVLVFLGIFTGAYFAGAGQKWLRMIVTFFLIATIVLYVVFDKEKKVPMRYTKRAVRGTLCVLSISTALVTSIYLVSHLISEAILQFRAGVFLIFPAFYPLLFVIIMTFVNFFERLNNLRYEERAKRILKNSSALKIAITGSYGKTSVKNYLHQLLSVKYNVLSTPESYNTPMGIAKTVSMLDLSCDIFIAEMGARRVNDIVRLMKIVKPQIGVLTGLNCQHLETFKTEQNIVNEKLHVVDMLDKDGFCVVSSSVLNKKFVDLSKKISANIVVAGNEGEVYASDLRSFEGGTKFKLHFDTSVYEAKTALLGRHNVDNLVLACAVAYKLGVPKELIVEKIACIEPVKHRLQLICVNGIKIIDDTFNSNPDGAKLALDTLATFEGRKVVVTPGLVELGSREYDENRILGERICAVADEVVLVGGGRAEQVREGLGDYGGILRHFDTLEEAQKSFKDFIMQGDVVLLLNDLPDIYDD